MTGPAAQILHYLPHFGIAVGMVLGCFGIWSVAFGQSKQDEAILRRIRATKTSNRLDDGSYLIVEPRGRSWMARLPLVGTLPARMQQAGMTMRPSPFLGICICVVAIAFIVWTKIFGFVLAAFLSLAFGWFVPVTIIAVFQKRRIDAFTAQLPDALDLMMRGLRVGHPINATIANVATNLSDPIAGEFRRMSDQIAYGDDLPDAFFDLADRIDQEDMHYLAVSIGIQYGTGGNLANLLGTLSSVIRKRATMRRRIKAVSSEGRISALILSALPVLIYITTSITAPGYYTSVSDDPLFIPMAVAMVTLVILNFLTLRKLANFRF